MTKIFVAVCLLFAISAVAQQQHGINIAWTPSPTNGVTSQIICRSTTTGTENCATPLTTIPNNTQASFLDTTGQAGTKYFYVLEACIGSICSAPSGEANAIFPTVPAPPSGVTANPQ